MKFAASKENNYIISKLKEVGAILEGHFILSSGMRSGSYIQCAKLFSQPKIAEELCKILADKIKSSLDINGITKILAPAMGGVIVGYELGRQLGIETIFCERVDGVFELRRNFEISPGDNILVVEDVITTGKSSLETIDLIKKFGGNTLAEACIINRNVDSFILPVVSLIDIEIEIFDKDNLPENLAKIPAIKPGSRPKI